jgi:hypothetical protein
VLPLAASATEREDRTFDGAAISSGGPFPPTFDAIQANVFSPSCAMSFCHGDAMSGNLDLREGAAYSNIVGVPSVELAGWNRIEPFAPDESFLICKLEACPSLVGQQMPLIGGPLDPAVINVMRQWVLKGAPEFPNVAVEADTWGHVKAQYR